MPLDIRIRDIKELPVTTERDSIFKVFNDDKLILLSYEKVWQGTFDIAKNFYQYKKDNGELSEELSYDGFYVWLIKNYWYKYIFESGDIFGVGQNITNKRFNDKNYIEIRKNYELLKELNEKGVLVLEVEDKEETD